MNSRFLNIFTLIASSTLFLAGCSDDSPFIATDTGESTNPGTVSQKHFSLLTADVNPAVIDGTTGIFKKTDVELTVYIGDRNDHPVTDAHTINFETEYGLVEASCITDEEGTCSVTWSAIERPDVGGPGSDGYVTITAYTIGEEAFTDTNGNNVFDDNDAAFEDLEEPYIDADYVPGIASNGFTTGDKIIDVVSTNDPTGVNEAHDIADGFFNGPGCTHTSLCGTAASIMIFDQVTMSIISNTYTIGGTVTGIPGGESLIIQNNSGDDLTITANGSFVFASSVADGTTYNVTVLTDPVSAACTITGGTETGTVSGANVTDVTITCS